MKSESNISPFYLSLVFNSKLYQNLFVYMMGGSTGRQRIRKTKLASMKIPLLDEEMMRSFSEVSRTVLESQSATFRILTDLSRLYEDVIYGESESDVLSAFIEECKTELKVVSSALQRSNDILVRTSNITYIT